MADVQQVEIKVPVEFTSNATDRRDLALEIIEYIQTRTQKGVGCRKQGRGFTNVTFPEYTKAYANRKGVRQGDVDLVLSGEMLDAIQYFPSKSSAGTLVIGFKAGSKANAKAEGNQLGSYGRSPNRKKARPFLGITSEDLLNLL